MKTIAIISMVFVLYSCSKEQTTTISVLHDDTEINSISVDTNLYNLYTLEEDNWKGASFRYQKMTDVDFNEITRFEIAPEIELLGNGEERKKLISSFKENVFSICMDSNSMEYPKSSIWIPIARELSYLSQLEEQDISLYILSDLEENSDWMNLYSKKNRKALKTNPESIRVLFRERISTREPIDNVKVYVIYSPENASDNAEFRFRIDSLYTPLFKELDIELNIQANFNN